MHLGKKFAASSRLREEDGRCVDGGINWPNERPTAARMLMIVKLVKHAGLRLLQNLHAQTTIISSWVHGFMNSWIHGWWIRETAYSYVVALIHDFEASSNIYQIANRDHRSAPETCRLGFVLNQASSMWNLECAQKYVQRLKGWHFGSIPWLVASRLRPVIREVAREPVICV